MLRHADVERFALDGYLIVRGVFSPEEIEVFRDTVGGLASQLESAHAIDGLWMMPGDVAAYSELSSVLTDPRMLSIARSLLGDRPVYFRDSAVAIAETIQDSGRGWHKDNRVPDRFDPLTADWQGEYPVIRMGIYCENHVEHSGGVALRVGSHRLRPTLLRRLLWGAVHRLRPRPGVRAHMHAITTGRAIHADTRAGDVVVWTLRTSHSGFAMRPRLAKNLKLPSQLETRLPNAFFLPPERPRVTMIITYGADSEHLDKLIEFLPTREYFRERNLLKPVCQEALDGFARQPDAIVLREPVPAAS